MAILSLEIWDHIDSKRSVVEVPDDIPVNRIIVVLVEKLKYPKYDATQSQLLSYKLHHKATRRQLLDDKTLSDAGVHNNDVLRMIPEIVAGGGHIG
ncbi:MAG: EsaB/YukD family protein [Bacillota bacterium]|nr:EsaB/YukD family protein [Bacillota bacterium]